MLAVAAAAVALAWLRPWPAPLPVPVRPPRLSVGVAGGRGSIDLSAHAVVDPGPKDTTLWYSIAIALEGPDWGHTFNGVWLDGRRTAAVQTRAPKGVATEAHLGGFRVPHHFEPGRYRVLVQVWEGTPDADAAGEVIGPAHPVIARQVWVTVD
jgi:hypothetical protein